MTTPVYILAGGKSSRFGADKALAQIAGVPLIARQATVLRAAGYQVVAVAEVAAKYATLGVETIGDSVPGLGPLGGLLTALAHEQKRGGRWIALTSCDMLELRTPWLDRLAAETRDDVQAVCFRGERWEPLPGLYCVSLLDDVRQRARRGELAMWRLLEAAKSVALPLPQDWPALAQANTPEDLQRFVEGRGAESQKGPG